MEIIDSYPDIIRLFARMAGRFDLASWHRYAEAISPELAELCRADSARYDFDAQVLPVLARAMARPDKLAEAHASFFAATKGLAARAQAAFGVRIPARIIFYLGLCGGAGWATRLDGQPAVLLGAEKIIELDWCDPATLRGLVEHEVSHLWHDVTGTLYCDTETPGEAALWQLYQEGIATYGQQLLAGDAGYYHQNRNGWLDWCQTRRQPLLAEYKRRVDQHESVQDFFGDWCSYQGYSDIGYYLGGQLARYLVERCSRAELLNQTPEGIYAALRALAASD